jgi:GH18 family chitinase
MNSGTIPAPTYRLVGYFPSWGIHAQNYHVTDIPAGQLTHVIYAFANVTAAGDCVSSNPADDQVNFPQLRQLKQQHPKLQILISVGGAANSTNFPASVANPTILLHFAQSCVRFMEVNGFDGVDIDWEYPTAAQTQSFTALLVELRRELDALGAITKRPYLLTIAAPAGSSNYAHLQLGQIHQHVDWIDLMAYDFTVVSSFVTDFVAPLQAYDSSIARHAESNAAAAVQAYLQAGVPASKLVLGTRFIGTGWQGVASSNNGLYQANHGPATGTWDAAGVPATGSFGYQDVALNYVSNTSRFWHVYAEVPWVFLPASGIMISYEDPQSLALKASYITANGLAGAMIWELGADDAHHTLVNSLADALTPPAGLTTYTVTGTVISPDSAGVVGLLVQLVDKTAGPDVPLGLTTTNAGGQYQISVGISPTTLQGRLKTAPDLHVRVFTGQTFLATSAVRYNASANETINITLPANVTALPSEYETLTAAIAVNYSGRIGALQENAQRSDITSLANKTGWDARAVAMGALADQFSQASVSSGVAGAGVGPEFYYALFRAGLPADPAVLYRVDLTTVSSTWQQAIDRGVIPRQLAGGLAAALESFRNIAALQILDTTAIQGASTLRSLLALTLSDAAHQQTFADLYTQHQRDLPTFWSEIQKTFGPDTTRRLQLDGQMAYLTLNSLKLISNLYAAGDIAHLTPRSRATRLLPARQMDSAPGRRTA